MIGFMISALANAQKKLFEENDPMYMPIDPILKDDLGDFGDDYKDSVEKAAEEINKISGATASGKKVKIPIPPKTEEQEDKLQALTDRAQPIDF